MNDQTSKIGGRRPSADQRVFDAIMKAVFEQRIPPGIRLREERLAEVFGVSRGRIRRVLLSLSHHNVVDLYPHRGAYVASPSASDAADVFSARRLLEELVVKRVTDRVSPPELKLLYSHVASEEVARNKGLRREAIRMAGEFHLLLARRSGSRVFRTMMEALMPQSSLIVGLFGAEVTSSCSFEEHAAILDAIAAGNVESACRLMTDHLLKLEGTLILDSAPSSEFDLAAIFEIGELDKGRSNRRGTSAG